MFPWPRVNELAARASIVDSTTTRNRRRRALEIARDSSKWIVFVSAVDLDTIGSLGMSAQREKHSIFSAGQVAVARLRTLASGRAGIRVRARCARAMRRARTPPEPRRSGGV